MRTFQLVPSSRLNPAPLGGIFEDVLSKVRLGVDALKELTTLHTEHVVRVELPSAADVTRRVLPLVALSAAAIGLGLYGAKRLLAPSTCST